MAQNVTVTLTIPPMNGSYVLRSVANWIVINSRINGSYPVNQTWAVYKAGHGDIMSNFWLGLEAVHQLTTSATYSLRIEVLSTVGA